MNDVTVFEDGDAAIVIDERSWPIITGTWFGATTETLVTQYFAHSAAQLARAGVGQRRIVILTDTYATKPPSAKVRQRIGELSRTQVEASRPRVLANYTVIESALIRGVVTALSWIDPSMADTKNVPSFEAGLAGALAELKAAGIPVPARLPTRQADPRRTARAG
jgi:hypothetical protein